MTSKLALQIPQINDCYSLRILDSSTYNEGITVSCGQLLITPPGFTYPAGFDVEKDFNVLLTSKSLGLSPKKASIEVLPEGVYIIRYSINPNDKVWVEYYHLRNCQQLNRYFSLLCKVGLEPCDNITPELEESMKTLSKIKLYIDTAKALVEYCNSPKKGMEIYEYANKLLTKLEGRVGDCKTC